MVCGTIGQRFESSWARFFLLPSPRSWRTGARQYGEVAEWSKAIDSKSIVLFLGDRGFESLPLLSVFGSRGGSSRGILPVLNALHKTYKVLGEVAERFKAHAWKACVGLYPTEGSNPSLSV